MQRRAKGSHVYNSPNLKAIPKAAPRGWKRGTFKIAVDPQAYLAESDPGERKGLVRGFFGVHAIHGEIHANVEVGSQLYTDEHMVFNDLDGLFYRHDTVNHALGEYARGPVSTNSIESVWAVLKRGLHGVYHHASKKHLFRYVDEFTFRLNEGNVERHSLERLASFVDATAGKRLTYTRLTA